MNPFHLLWLWLAMSATTSAYPAERPDARIRVAAYNVENFLWMESLQADGTTSRRFKPEASVAALVRILAELNADVLLLSEIGTSEDLESLRKMVADAGVDYPHSAHLEGADDVRRLGLLSRHPVTGNHSRGVLAFEAAGQREFMRRGILDVILEAPDGHAFRVISLHLKSKLESPADQELLRRHEAHLVRQHIDAISEEFPDVPLLVAGDFNDLINSTVVREILGARGTPGALTALPLADANGHRWTHYWQEADLYSRIDFIMVNPVMRRHLVRDSMGVWHSADWRTASDHRPVWAEFIFPEP